MLKGNIHHKMSHKVTTILRKVIPRNIQVLLAQCSMEISLKISGVIKGLFEVTSTLRGATSEDAVVTSRTYTGMQTTVTTKAVGAEANTLAT
jgi:hypothetical protein